MLTRWLDSDPLRDMTTLRDAMNQLFEQSIVRPGALAASGFIAPMNVYEVDNTYVVQAYVPGLKAEDVEVTARQNTLIIKGRLPEPVSDDKKQRVTWLLQELGGGEFTRSVAFPKAIDADHVEARYDQGVLTLVLPVSQHERPRKITISGAGASSVESLPGEQMQPQLAGSNGQ